MSFVTKVLPGEPDSVSPGGGAEIRHIITSPPGDLTHAVCPAGYVAPTHHLPELDELYYVLAGEGEIWRETDARAGVTALRPGRWVQLPAGMRFQYRANCGSSLVFLVVVLPSWRPDLFHTLPEGLWPAGADDQAPPTSPADLVDHWMSGDLPWLPDDLALDGSEIRSLGSFDRGGLAHCSLRAGSTSRAVRHSTVSQIWYVIDGHGEMWRAAPDGDEEIVPLRGGIGIDIPAGTSFQFRATGVDPLRVVVLTMPRWPGPSEAVPVPGPWNGSTEL